MTDPPHHPDYLWYITVQPLGTGKMQATRGLAVPPEILAGSASHEPGISWLRCAIDSTMARGWIRAKIRLVEF